MASTSLNEEMMLVSYENVQKVVVCSKRLEEAKRTVLLDFALDQQGYSASDLTLFLQQVSGQLFEFTETAWARLPALSHVVVKTKQHSPTYAGVVSGLANLRGDNLGGNDGNGGTGPDIEGWRRGGAAHCRTQQTGDAPFFPPTPPMSISGNRSRRDSNPMMNGMDDVPRVPEHAISTAQRPLSRRTSFPVNQASFGQRRGFSSNFPPLPALCDTTSSTSSSSSALFTPQSSPHSTHFSRIGHRLGLPAVEKRASVASMASGKTILSPSPIRRSASQEFLATYNVQSPPRGPNQPLMPLSAPVQTSTVLPTSHTVRRTTASIQTLHQPLLQQATPTHRVADKALQQKKRLPNSSVVQTVRQSILLPMCSPALQPTAQAQEYTSSSGESAFSSDSEDEDDGCFLSKAMTPASPKPTHQSPNSLRKLKSTPGLGRWAGAPRFTDTHAVPDLDLPPLPDLRMTSQSRRLPTSWPNSPIATTTARAANDSHSRPRNMLSLPSLDLGDFMSPTGRPDSPMPAYCLRDAPSSSSQQLANILRKTVQDKERGGTHRPRSKSVQEQDGLGRDSRTRTTNPPVGFWPSTAVSGASTSAVSPSSCRTGQMAGGSQPPKRQLRRQMSSWVA